MPYQSAVVLVGAAMIIYVAFGGMLATTWVQIVKAILVLAAAAVILMMVLAMLRFDPLTLFQQAETRYGPRYLLPGNYLKNPFDQISLGLGYVCGLAGLPHVMTRFYTVPDAKTARRSVVWVMFLVGFFFAGTTLFGLAAADFVGQDAIRAADREATSRCRSWLNTWVEVRARGAVKSCSASCPQSRSRRSSRLSPG
jgi:cation/acetate symporter